MPGQGEQHKPAATSVNPFEEVKPHVSEYTAQEIATLSSRLEKQLGPEYISSRPGAGGGKVHYLSADKCINLANEVFGFNGWSSGIQNIQIDFVDESQSTGKVSLGLSVVVRVTLRDGTFHEDIGYGHIENCKGKAAAFEKAKKEGTTDGLKRALRNFGNLLGNCVYDKDYVAKVTKLKIAPTKWDPENLHRHPDFAPIRRESAVDALSRQLSIPSLKREWPTETEDMPATVSNGDPEDEFGCKITINSAKEQALIDDAGDDFDEADFSVPQTDHPDEVMLNPSISFEHFRRRNSNPGKANAPATCTTNNNSLQRSKLPLNRNSLETFDHAAALQLPTNRRTSNLPSPSSIVEGPQKLAAESKPQHVPTTQQQIRPPITGQQPLTPRLPQDPPPPAHGILNEATCLDPSSTSEHNPPVGFFTARAAESLQNGPGLPLKAPAFNPHLESPSIRKTAGVDHTKTKPVGREAVGVPPQPTLPRTNFVNPQSDKTRRVGMPMGAASPLQNRGSYKPPQIKRPVETSGPRLALGDVTNLVSDAGGDVKRQKIGLEAQGVSSNEKSTNS